MEPTTYRVTVENIVCGKRHLRRVQAATSDEAGAKACEEWVGLMRGSILRGNVWRRMRDDRK